MITPSKTPVAEVEETTAPVVDKVFNWRLEVLERAGYDPSGARLVARRRHIDLHFAVGLLQRGCPVNTALAILL